MEHSKPLMIELFAGLHGWGEGALMEGWRVVGFDIVDMCKDIGHPRPAGDIQLVLQDVRTLHGSQFKDASLIVASPPCQEFSYMAMPWSKAKEKEDRLKYRPEDDRKRLTALFDACFRIQREAIEAAGHHIPLVVENVRGAQKWVGRSRWNYGSFHLWGDVPALMPMTKAFKSSGLNWSDRTKHGQDFTRRAAEHIKNTGGSWFNVAHNTTSGVGRNPDGRKVGGDGFFERDSEWMHVRGGPGSPARKAASAMIARIPLPLARHIARYWKPLRSQFGIEAQEAA